MQCSLAVVRMGGGGLLILCCAVLAATPVRADLNDLWTDMVDRQHCKELTYKKSVDLLMLYISALAQR